MSDRIIALAEFFEGDDAGISPPITEADNALIAKGLRLLASYDARVSELLAANNREVERRRAAEADRDRLRARLDALKARKLARPIGAGDA